MQRVTTVLLAIFAVIVLAGAVYVIAENGSAPKGSADPTIVGLPSQAGSTPTPTSLPASSAPASSAPDTGQVPSAATQPVVVFLGDEWTSGSGASSKKKRFSSLLAKRLHLDERNLGRNGAGYSGTNPYLDRVDDVAAAKPDVIIVAGGRDNIVDNDADAAEAATTKLFAALHAKVPDAVLIAIAPMWGDSDPPQTLGALGDAVKTAVTAAGGTYLDVADPINGHPTYMADDSNPDDQGYTAIADLLAPKIADLLPS